MYPAMFLDVEPLVSRRSCIAETTKAAIFRGLILLPFPRETFVPFPAILTPDVGTHASPGI